MDITKKFCALLIALSVTGFSVMAHDQQDKDPPKEKPRVKVVDKNEDNKNNDRDREKNDKKGKDNKKPGEEF